MNIHKNARLTPRIASGRVTARRALEGQCLPCQIIQPGPNSPDEAAACIAGRVPGP